MKDVEMNDKNKNRRRRMVYRDTLPKEDKKYMEVSIYKNGF